MECKITSTKRSRVKAAGMTLMEMMVATAIGSMTLGAIASLSFYTARSFAALTNYVDLDKHSRHALDTMTRFIRQADGLVEYETNYLSFAYGTNTLTYFWDPATGILSQTFTNGTENLLTECAYLRFDIYQRNPIEGVYDVYPSSLGTNDKPKMVQVTWLCYRSILGEAINTESVQSAKIVIRRQ